MGKSSQQIAAMLNRRMKGMEAITEKRVAKELRSKGCLFNVNVCVCLCASGGHCQMNARAQFSPFASLPPSLPPSLSRTWAMSDVVSAELDALRQSALKAENTAQAAILTKNAYVRTPHPDIAMKDCNLRSLAITDAFVSMQSLSALEFRQIV